MVDLMTVAGVVFKTSLVVVAAGLFSLALRRQSAAFGHVVWTSALALCVLMPAAILLLPSHSAIALPIAPTLPLPRALSAREGIQIRFVTQPTHKTGCSARRPLPDKPS